jgi:hypothetical protein
MHLASITTQSGKQIVLLFVHCLQRNKKCKSPTHLFFVSKIVNFVLLESTLLQKVSRFIRTACCAAKARMEPNWGATIMLGIQP